MKDNKVKIADYYHYSQTGSDFTNDMHEKQNDISPIKPFPVLRTHYIATKDLDLAQTRNQSRKPTHMDSPRKSNFDVPAHDDHPGIPTIRKMEPIPKFINNDLKNPRDFEALVENMTERYIPAMLIAPSTPCAKIIVFFHANAEDIGQAYSFCKDINEKLEVGIHDTSATSSW